MRDEQSAARASAVSAIVAETPRLVLRRFDIGDAPFIMKLVNEPSWINYIGDKHVATLEDAARYLRDGPMRMHERFGFGLDLVQLKATGEPIGMCGLIRREELEDVDLGFAFLPAHWGSGYALEAARATMAHGRDALGLRRIVAIVTPDNAPSQRLLSKLGFTYERTIRSATEGEEVWLYGTSV